MEGGLMLGAASLAAGVVGVVIGLRHGRRRRQRLVHQASVMRYFDKSDYPLPAYAEMSYEGMEVERLSKATVVLWNGGTDALRGEDIVASDPIRLSVGEGGRCLEVEVERTSDASNGCTAEKRAEHPHEVVLGYDYLNPGEGMRVMVLHDGVDAEPQVLGRAKGLAGGPESRGVVESGATVARMRTVDWRWLVMRWAVSVVLLLAVAVAVFGSLSALAPVLPEYLVGPRTILAVTVVVSAGVTFWFVPAIDRGGVPRRFPKALEEVQRRRRP